MRVWVLYDLSRVFSFVILALCLIGLASAIVIHALQPHVSRLAPGLVNLNNIIRSDSSPICRKT
jgi:hypothetical protein